MYNSRMIIVIIAGGQGTRLWPLSKPEHPKHLLSLINDDSLLQNTINRVKSLTESIFIIPEESHADKVQQQLPEFANKLLIEPARRGTANCILYALAKLKNKFSSDEVVVFLHADHHIGDIRSFKKAVDSAVKASDNLNKITLIGVAPDYPATGFGYIKSGEEIDSQNGVPVLKVEEFVEKPDEKTARKYLKSHQYLWNVGLFAGSIKTFEREIQKNNTSMWERYNLLLKDQYDEYLNFPIEPIDTALIEKIDDLAVVPGKFDWADIGSFKDLYEILRNGESNVHRGGVYDVDSKDSIVLADKKPIITIGLEKMIVIDTPEGILVCPLDKCQLIKEGVEKLNSITNR